MNENCGELSCSFRYSQPQIEISYALMYSTRLYLAAVIISVLQMGRLKQKSRICFFLIPKESRTQRVTSVGSCYLCCVLTTGEMFLRGRVYLLGLVLGARVYELVSTFPNGGRSILYKLYYNSQS